MRKTEVIAGVILAALMIVHAQATGSGKKVALYAVEAEWGYQNGMGSILKPCDPPEPKGSNIVCSEPSKVYTFSCPDSAIGLLPPEASRYSYVADPDSKVHPTVYCIVPGEQ